MRIKHLIVPAIAMLSVVLLAGCQKNMDPNFFASSSPGVRSATTAALKIIIPQKKVDLGVSGNFNDYPQLGARFIPSTRDSRYHYSVK